MICSEIYYAQSIIVDRFTNQMSLINVLEDISLSSFPGLLPITICSIYERSTSSESSNEIVDIQIELNSEPLVKVKIDLIFHDDKLKARNIAALGFLPISNAGTLKISFHNQGKMLGSKEFKISSKSEV